ncbi:MAG: chorismate mutase [Bacillaceae bacterium]|mgnify:CR=1 FL=1|uniref:chorismate mutase n=1 Tax=Alkalihalobacterium chitinilyticum TaxID=2980103 RepID=A0ABT5V8Y4_9BACI|nr:chorismate mutase [Alkalihalobacterium chitinilyticum]MDE5411922.1 chorismate mutase [Alkalihalobacterium chitinilyticum]MEB1806840.1 chorismate mutase [Bacillaceae bacterium]
MIRGIRGATTVEVNEEEVILDATEKLLETIITKNGVKPEDVAQIVVTVTHDLNATFPAKALRRFEGWKFVPIMCALEIPVPNSLPMCIRVMITAETDVPQSEVEHIYLENAISLRPDLQLTNKEDSR